MAGPRARASHRADPVACVQLATARGLASTTLAAELGVADATEDELYAALDWLLARQASVERALSRRHLRPDTPVLLDVSSTWFEGRCCPLAAHGYSRDGRADRPQLVFGLLTDQDGRPVAIQAFPGNPADPATLGGPAPGAAGLFRAHLLDARG
jgi:hypothetical protein